MKRCSRPSFLSKKNKIPKLHPRVINWSVTSMQVYSSFIGSPGFVVWRNRFNRCSPRWEKCSLRDEKPSWALIGNNCSNFVSNSLSLSFTSFPVVDSGLSSILPKTDSICNNRTFQRTKDGHKTRQVATAMSWRNIYINIFILDRI